MALRDFSEDQRHIYNWGMEDALKFRSGSHLLHQDVFRAESEDWKVYCGYDDVDEGNFIEVTFKRRWDRQNDCPLKVMMCCGSARKAVARALRFIAAHPVAEPHCDVDY